MREVADNLRRFRERLAEGLPAPAAGDGSGGHARTGGRPRAGGRAQAGRS